MTIECNAIHVNPITLSRNRDDKNRRDRGTATTVLFKKQSVTFASDFVRVNLKNCNISRAAFLRRPQYRVPSRRDATQLRSKLYVTQTTTLALNLRGSK